MTFLDQFNQRYENDALAIIPDLEEVEVFPLVGIPIECEDQLIHDGENPCGDPDCPCATYGYNAVMEA